MRLTYMLFTVKKMLPYTSSSNKRRGQQCILAPSNHSVVANKVMETVSRSQTNMLGKTSGILN